MPYEAMPTNVVSMISVVMPHLKAERAAPADSADLTLTALISAISSATFSAICLEAEEHAAGAATVR